MSLSSTGSAGRLLVDEPAPHVARLTISNPDKRGALDQAILDSFADFFHRFRSQDFIGIK